MLGPFPACPMQIPAAPGKSANAKHEGSGARSRTRLFRSFPAEHRLVPDFGKPALAVPSQTRCLGSPADPGCLPLGLTPQWNQQPQPPSTPTPTTASCSEQENGSLIPPRQPLPNLRAGREGPDPGGRLWKELFGCWL